MCPQTGHFACVALVALLALVCCVFLLLSAHLLEHFVICVFLNLNLFGRGSAIIGHPQLILTKLITALINNALLGSELRDYIDFLAHGRPVCSYELLCLVCVSSFMSFISMITSAIVLGQSLAIITVTVLNIQLWLHIYFQVFS